MVFLLPLTLKIIKMLNIFLLALFSLLAQSARIAKDFRLIIMEYVWLLVLLEHLKLQIIHVFPVEKGDNGMEQLAL